MARLDFSFPSFPDALIDEKIDITSLAKDDAGFNLPETGASSLSSTELSITRAIQNFYNNSLSKFNRSAIEQALQDNDAYRKADGHEGQISSLEADLKTLYSKSKDNIKNQYIKYKKDKDALSFFQKENRIYEPANLKSSSAKILSVSIVIGMFIFEASANTSILTGSISGGILGAISLASIISFINIVASFLFGRFVVPNMLHAQRSRKNFAGLITCFYAPLIIYINCAVGVFRSLSEAATQTFDSEMMSQVALMAAWPFDDFASNSVASNGLIILGLMFAIIAILDGFYFDEPYPNYGKASRQAADSETVFFESKTSGFNLLAAKQKEGNYQITSYKDKRASGNKEWANAIDAVQAGFALYPEWVNSLRAQANSYVNSYRAENTKFRSSEPPDYFANPVELQMIADPAIQFKSLVSANIEDSAKEQSYNEADRIIIGEYNDAIVRLNRIYDEVRESYENFIKELS